MIIYIGADHRGFELKENLKERLLREAYEVVDLGNEAYDENDDYPDFAEAVAGAVAQNPAEDRGIVICGSGVGVDVVANKFGGVRSALVATVEQARLARQDDDVNVLAIAADFIDTETAFAVADMFLETEFDHAENHQRRIDKIDALESGISEGEEIQAGDEAGIAE